MEHVLIELLIAVLVCAGIFLIVRLAAGGLGLPGWVVQATGIVLVIILLVWLIRLLPALVG